MVKVFNSPFRITQEFGKNPDYYKQFGLAGHEGLDLVPTGSDWTIFSLPYKGIVVKDVDTASKGGAYGNHCTIWYPDIKEAWMYCHMSSNNTYIEQEISPTSPIGVMGNTGNTTGAHLHINRFQVDERGYRLNKDNGYLGGIDPLPFLQKNIGETPSDPPADEDPYKKKGIELLDAYRSERQQGPEGNWESFARAIIQSDRDVITLRGDLARVQQQKEDLIKEHDAKLKAVKEQAKISCDTEKTELAKDWQTKVEAAKKEGCSEWTASQHLQAFFDKLFGKKSKGGE